uniref:Uncharacterized protein n=1 Tax=Cucumis melo TaxID=3656 RepID=A0A9I9EFJ4_CUCME
MCNTFAPQIVLTGTHLRSAIDACMKSAVDIKTKLSHRLMMLTLLLSLQAMDFHFIQIHAPYGEELDVGQSVEHMIKRFDLDAQIVG